MVLQAFQILGFIVGVMSWAGMIGTCASPEWRKNSQGRPAIVGPSQSYDGLWVRCLMFNTGEIQCTNNNAFYVKQKDVLFVCRGLMIAALNVGFVAILTTILGMKCVTIGGQNVKSKARVALSGGILFAVGGILSGASVSYYAHHMVQEYYNPILPLQEPMNLRFEYGYALFIGWATLVLGLLSAIILISISVAIMRGSNNNQSNVSSSSLDHKYKPVSILQRFQATNENIPMQVRPGSNALSEMGPRHIRMERKDPAARLNQTNGYGRYSGATSSGRQVHVEAHRPYVDRQHLTREEFVLSQAREQRRTMEARNPQPKQRQAKPLNAPPEGLVRSVSGSLRQYV